MAATLTLNPAHNGIEIKFDTKPIQDTLAALKSHGFRWHRQKCLWYAKNTPERLEFAHSVSGSDVCAAPAHPQKATPDPVNTDGVKVGDVFFESWGYEQTNIDFWQVVKLRGTTQVVLRAIGQQVVEECGFCSVMVKPLKGSWTKHYAGDEITRTVKGTAENPYCNSEHGLLWLTTWDAAHNETSYY